MAWRSIKLWERRDRTLRARTADAGFRRFRGVSDRANGGLELQTTCTADAPAKGAKMASPRARMRAPPPNTRTARQGDAVAGFPATVTELPLLWQIPQAAQATAAFPAVKREKFAANSVM
jgi:hypothetical protein